MTTTLSEARRLYELGFAILLLHPKSKRPIGNRWTSGSRTLWVDIKNSYKEGDNIGVRTGEPSTIGKYYLACIDVDIKNPAFRDRAEAKLAELIGDQECPEVKSGSGSGSKHLYCVTEKPFKMITIEKHDEWEICVYSNGRQMVLPPSRHPSGALYKWVKPIKSIKSLPLIQFDTESDEKLPTVIKDKPLKDGPFAFEITDVNLDWCGLSSEMKSSIKKGSGVENRSDFLLNAATALVTGGCDRDEVLSVLTDPANWISSASRERRGSNRMAQAQWLWEYTVKKVFDERAFKVAFTNVKDMPPEKKLTANEIEKQSRDFLTDRNWRQELKRSGQNGGGPPIGNIDNVVKILVNAVNPKVVLRNTFAYRDSYGVPTPWGGKVDEYLSDDEVVKIKYWLSQNFGFEPKSQIIEEALIILACKNSFNPVTDWLDGLAPWDGKPRLHTWLRENFQATGDKEYLGQVFFKWILAMVARAYEPGIKFDWMPIFEGKQGIGKSSFGRLLVTDKYFLDSLPNITDKDSALALQGIWSVEMGELANMRRTQLEDVKSYITRTIDKVRPPYGRRWIESPRRCVFFGTTNRQTYLVDDTGNRRFKPVEVGRLNFKALKEDRDQLFAEARAFYKEKGINELSFELTNGAKVFEAQIHQEKMVADESSAMQEAFEDFIEKVRKEQAVFVFEKFRILDLFEGAGPLNKWRPDNRNLQHSAKMLRKLGAERKKIQGLYYWKMLKGAGFDEEPSPLDFR